MRGEKAQNFEPGRPLLSSCVTSGNAGSVAKVIFSLWGKFKKDVELSAAAAAQQGPMWPVSRVITHQGPPVGLGCPIKPTG